MNVDIRLAKKKSWLTKKGFPIIIYASNYNNKAEIRIKKFAFPKEWNEKLGNVRRNHPHYVNTYDYIANLKDKIQRIERKGMLELIQLKDLKNHVFQKESDIFYVAAQEIIPPGRNGELYRTVLNSFDRYYPDFRFEQITRIIVQQYQNSILLRQTNNGVHTYMRTLNSIWNKIGKPNNPFIGVRPKLVKTINPIHTLEDLIKIQDLKLDNNNNTKGGGYWHYRNYYMLLFYLGGIYPIDLFNLRYDQHVLGKRIKFKRFKGNTDEVIDNLIVDQAREILEMYDCRPYLVPAFSNSGKSKYFTDNFRNRFRKLCQPLELDCEPTLKSPRYTFINRAKNLGIDQRITEEIVGHANRTTHSIYTGRYPDHVRDEAHKKIIDFKLL